MRYPTPRTQQQRGLSLIELLVVLAVVAVILGVGVPGFGNLVANSRMSSATNAPVTSVHRARSEALTRRVPVVVCPTPDGAGACQEGASLASGWTVFVDRDDDAALDAEDVVLERHGPMAATLQPGVSRTTAALAFTAAGTLRPDPGRGDAEYLIQLCDPRGDVDTGGGIAAGRLIQVSPLGRQQLVRDRASLQSDRNPLRGC